MKHKQIEGAIQEIPVSAFAFFESSVISAARMPSCPEFLLNYHRDKTAHWRSVVQITTCPVGRGLVLRRFSPLFKYEFLPRSHALRGNAKDG
ncbi:MAG: hypothetical protein H8E46_11665 [FCB group bacterium]|nr:hypothetical protein [FCB group bacterium]